MTQASKAHADSFLFLQILSLCSEASDSAVSDHPLSDLTDNVQLFISDSHGNY